MFLRFNVIISNRRFILSAVISKGKDLLFRRRIDFPVPEEPSPFGRLKIEIVAVNVTSVQSIDKRFFSDNNHIFKFFIKGFKNLPSSFFFNSENLLSSIDQCTGSFIQTFKTR